MCKLFTVTEHCTYEGAHGLAIATNMVSGKDKREEVLGHISSAGGLLSQDAFPEDGVPCPHNHLKDALIYCGALACQPCPAPQADRVGSSVSCLLFCSP